jgi:O-antigen/teichoic acid export membrane protein
MSEEALPLEGNTGFESGATAVADAPPEDLIGTDQVPPPPLRRLAVSVVTWTLIGYAVMLVLRFGVNLTLTHLLAPRVFGLMALVSLFVQGIAMFADFGIGQSVIFSSRGEDPEFLDRAWTLQVLRGIGLWLLSMLMAWPLARLYEEPALIWLIPTVGASACIGGFTSMSLFVLSRRMVRRELVLLETVTYSVGIGAALGGILWLRWSAPALDPESLQTGQLLMLAGGNLLSLVLRLIISFRLMPELRHSFRWFKERDHELWNFGAWIFVSTACGFLASQADRLVIGKLSLGTLGVYHLATVMACMPTVLVGLLTKQFLFPLYSRVRTSHTDLSRVIAVAHQATAGLAALMVTVLIIAGPTLIQCLYDKRYQEAGWFIQLLGGVTWFSMLQQTSECVLESLGHTRCMAISQMVKLVILPFLLIGGHHLGGLTGLILGFGCAEACRYLLVTWFVKGTGYPVFHFDAALTLLLIVLTTGLIAAGPWLWEAQPPFVRLVLETIGCVLVWIPGFYLWCVHNQISPVRMWTHPR